MTSPTTSIQGITGNAIKELLWKTEWKLKVELPYDLAIPLLDIHTKDSKIGS